MPGTDVKNLCSAATESWPGMKAICTHRECTYNPLATRIVSPLLYYFAQLGSG